MRKIMAEMKHPGANGRIYGTNFFPFQMRGTIITIIIMDFFN